MIYLLDVNALLAFAVVEHVFHNRTERWMSQASGKSSFGTCAITELGFLRVLLHTAAGGVTVGQAQQYLKELKASDKYRLTFIADDHDAEHLPGWVYGAKQLTDGHLAALAQAHGGILATLDQGIPGAFLIPH